MRYIVLILAFIALLSSNAHAQMQGGGTIVPGGGGGASDMDAINQGTTWKKFPRTVLSYEASTKNLTFMADLLGTGFTYDESAVIMKLRNSDGAGYSRYELVNNGSQTLDMLVAGSTVAGTFWGFPVANLAYIYAHASNALLVYTYDEYPLVFGTHNTERMRFDKDGNTLFTDVLTIEVTGELSALDKLRMKVNRANVFTLETTGARFFDALTIEADGEVEADNFTIQKDEVKFELADLSYTPSFGYILTGTDPVNSYFYVGDDPNDFGGRLGHPGMYLANDNKNKSLGFYTINDYATKDAFHYMKAGDGSANQLTQYGTTSTTLFGREFKNSTLWWGSHANEFMIANTNANGAVSFSAGGLLSNYFNCDVTKNGFGKRENEDMTFITDDTVRMTIEADGTTRFNDTFTIETDGDMVTDGNIDTKYNDLSLKDLSLVNGNVLYELGNGRYPQLSVGGAYFDDICTAGGHGLFAVNTSTSTYYSRCASIGAFDSGKNALSGGGAQLILGTHTAAGSHWAYLKKYSPVSYTYNGFDLNSGMVWKNVGTNMIHTTSQTHDLVFLVGTQGDTLNGWFDCGLSKSGFGTLLNEDMVFLSNRTPRFTIEAAGNMDYADETFYVDNTNEYSWTCTPIAEMYMSHEGSATVTLTTKDTWYTMAANWLYDSSMETSGFVNNYMSVEASSGKIYVKKAGKYELTMNQSITETSTYNPEIHAHVFVYDDSSSTLSEYSKIGGVLELEKDDYNQGYLHGLIYDLDVDDYVVIKVKTSKDSTTMQIAHSTLTLEYRGKK